MSEFSKAERLNQTLNQTEGTVHNQSHKLFHMCYEYWDETLCGVRSWTERAAIVISSSLLLPYPTEFKQWIWVSNKGLKNQIFCNENVKLLKKISLVQCFSDFINRNPLGLWLKM